MTIHSKSWMSINYSSPFSSLYRRMPLMLLENPLYFRGIIYSVQHMYNYILPLALIMYVMGLHHFPVSTESDLSKAKQ